MELQHADEIADFFLDQIFYITPFNELRLSVNELIDLVEELKDGQPSIADRVSDSVQKSDIPAIYNDIKDDPIDMSNVPLSTLTFAGVTPDGSFLGNNLLAKIPSVQDMVFPSSGVSSYVYINNGVLSISPTYETEKVLNFSNTNIGSDPTSFLYNRAGVIGFSTSIPPSAFGLTSNSGLPPGSIVMACKSHSDTYPSYGINGGIYYTKDDYTPITTTSSDNNKFSFVSDNVTSNVNTTALLGSAETVSLTLKDKGSDVTVSIPRCQNSTGCNYFYNSTPSKNNAILSFEGTTAATPYTTMYGSTGTRYLVMYKGERATIYLTDPESNSWFTSPVSDGAIFHLYFGISTTRGYSLPNIVDLADMISFESFEDGVWKKILSVGFRFSIESSFTNPNGTVVTGSIPFERYFIESDFFLTEKLVSLPASFLVNSSVSGVIVIIRDGIMKLFLKDNNLGGGGEGASISLKSGYSNPSPTSSKRVVISSPMYNSSTYIDRITVYGKYVNSSGGTTPSTTSHMYYGGENPYRYLNMSRTDNYLSRSSTVYRLIPSTHPTTENFQLPKIKYSELFSVMGDYYTCNYLVFTPPDIKSIVYNCMGYDDRVSYRSDIFKPFTEYHDRVTSTGWISSSEVPSDNHFLASSTYTQGIRVPDHVHELTPNRDVWIPNMSDSSFQVLSLNASNAGANLIVTKKSDNYVTSSKGYTGAFTLGYSTTGYQGVVRSNEVYYYLVTGK